jgi:hypothetical protein
MQLKFYQLYSPFSDVASCIGSMASAVSPRLVAKLAKVAWVHCLSDAHRAHARADTMTSYGTCSRSRALLTPSMLLAMRQSCFALPREAWR